MNNFYFSKHKMLSQQSINNLRSKYKRLNVSEFFSLGKKLSMRCSDLKDLIDQSTPGRKRDYYSDQYEKELEKLDIWKTVLEQVEEREQQYRKDEKIIAYGHPGRILRVNRNGTYDIRFNNGDFKGSVSPSMIRHRLDNRRFFDSQSDQQYSSDGSLQQGDRVMVRARSGKEYPGRIRHMHRNGFFDIMFDNGDFQENLSPSIVRRKYARRDRGFGSQSDEQMDSFRIDDIVWVRFRGGKEYMGRITRKHSNGTYDVRFVDGDFKRNISKSSMRHHVRSPSPRARRDASFCSIM